MGIVNFQEKVKITKINVFAYGHQPSEYYITDGENHKTIASEKEAIEYAISLGAKILYGIKIKKGEVLMVKSLGINVYKTPARNFYAVATSFDPRVFDTSRKMLMPAYCVGWKLIK